MITWWTHSRMARNILVDTSAIYAFVSAGDRYHTQSREVYSELLERGDQLYTTSYVLVESSALIHRRLGFEALRAFIESIQGGWEILWVYESAHEQIWDRMKAQGGSRLSLVDWSVVISAEETRATIFAFDSDFSQEGLTVIPAQSH